MCDTAFRCISLPFIAFHRGTAAGVAVSFEDRAERLNLPRWAYLGPDADEAELLGNPAVQLRRAEYEPNRLLTVRAPADGQLVLAFKNLNRFGTAIITVLVDAGGVASAAAVASSPEPKPTGRFSIQQGKRLDEPAALAGCPRELGRVSSAAPTPAQPPGGGIPLDYLELGGLPFFGSHSIVLRRAVNKELQLVEFGRVFRRVEAVATVPLDLQDNGKLQNPLMLFGRVAITMSQADPRIGRKGALDRLIRAVRDAGAVALVLVNFGDRPLQSPSSPLFHLGQPADGRCDDRMFIVHRWHPSCCLCVATNTSAACCCCMLLHS